uniref:ETS domain-containing protein n=1 Tax=Clastoptera arizonana TaxID=38151 RepID=A0A1B6CUP1_9HEMI
MMDFQNNFDYFRNEFDIVSVMIRQNSNDCGAKMLMHNNDPYLNFEDSGLININEHLKQENEYINIDCWRNKAIEEWTCTDVMAWVAAEADSLRVMVHDSPVHYFIGLDGIRLKQMDEDDFKNISLSFGPSLYRRFQNLKTPPLNRGVPGLYHMDSSPSQLPYEDYFLKEESGHNNYYSQNYTDETNSSGYSCSPVHKSLADNESGNDSGIELEHVDINRPPAKRRPGRPKGSRRKKKPEKLGRLWEFIRDLLLNENYCPRLIRWDNYEEGMFQFVHSDEVAKLWGTKKDNPHMNYEKLSRAMRYYYKSKVLLPVLGRRLVYKFGPTATGWKTSNPNFSRRG